LRFFAELSGSYPEKIDVTSTMKAINKMKTGETEVAVQFKKQMKAAKGNLKASGTGI